MPEPDDIKRHTEAVAVGLMLMMCMIAGMLVGIIGVAVVAVGEVYSGAGILIAGGTLIWFAFASIDGGPANRWWVRTVGRVAGSVDETFVEMYEPVKPDEEVSES